MVETTVAVHKLVISIDTFKVDESKSWDVFFDHKKEKETFGIAKVPRDLIYFGDIPYTKYVKYLEVGRYVNPETVIQLRETDYEFFQSYFELFPKLVWLLDEYVSSGSFENPVGLLWNPILSQYEIHPGGSRKIILSLSDAKFFTGVTFNAKGQGIKPDEFKSIFNSKQDVEHHFVDKKISLGLTPDNGTLYPHVHFNMQQILDKSTLYSKRVNDFLDTTYLDADFIDNWNVTGNVKSKPNKVELRLSANLIQNRTAQLIAIALACLNRDISWNGIKLIHTRK